MPCGFPLSSSLLLDYHVKQYIHVHTHKLISLAVKSIVFLEYNKDFNKSDSIIFQQTWQKHCLSTYPGGRLMCLVACPSAKLWDALGWPWSAANL